MDYKLWGIAAAALLLSITVIGLSGSQDIDITGSTGNVAIIPLSGSITSTASTGLGATTGITPAQVRDLNDRAESRGADAIVYNINSGGGAVVASKDVLREIEAVEVPTVCRFRDVGASGAYLFALGCDRIVADSATLTGSIGVRSSYFQYTGLMNKLGLKYINISSGEYKALGSPYENITEEEKDMLQMKADRIHEEFAGMVQDRRNLSDETMETVATGEPFLGDRAQELGLVDTLGGRRTAIDEAENLTGKDLDAFTLQTAPSFSLFSLFGASSFVENFVNQGSPLKAVY